jgi:hypothetical protein
VAFYCLQDNVSSDSIKYVIFFEQLSNYEFLKNNSTTWGLIINLMALTSCGLAAMSKSMKVLTEHFELISCSVPT